MNFDTPKVIIILQLFVQSIFYYRKLIAFRHFVAMALLLCATNVVPSWATESTPPFVVVIDAGHGGKDPGNRGNGYYEKHIALSIAMAIGKQLEKEESIKVVYTRQKDVFVELDQRAKIANNANADLFISIHCDSFTDSRAYGAGTFVLGLHATDRNFEIAKRENSVIFYEENYEERYEGFDPNNPESIIGLTLMQETYLDQSIIAASEMQKSFVSELSRKDRDVKQAGFLVLRKTYMPSVLVETGFLSNPKEGAYLNSQKGRTEMASAIAKAIVNYKEVWENSYRAETNFFDQTQQNSGEVGVFDSINSEAANAISFKVQIIAGKRFLDTKPNNFKGLKGVSRTMEDGIYRYFYGHTQQYKQARVNLRKARRSGYDDAFLVAFKAGQRISMKEALKSIQ